MQIASNLPLPLNAGRSPLLKQQRRAADSGQATPSPDTSRPSLATSDQATRQFRFVMPENATSHSGQIALREYQMIQNEGGPELVNRIDVRV